MNVRDLIPWRGSNQALTRYHDEQSPFLALHRDINRLFDETLRGFDLRNTGFGSLSSSNSAWPSVEISETDKEVTVTAEVPGLEEKDIEVLLNNQILTLRGEKQSDHEDKDRQFSERFYGRFERQIPIGTDIAEDGVKANFKNGVLTISLPKTEQAQARTRRIPVNAG